MAIEAAVTQYRKQFTAAFEQRMSSFRACTTKETVLNGNTATFLVSGSGTDTAVTRGTNGMIPYGNPTNTQVSATLVEKHAPYELTGFNIFASQGDQKRIMQENSMAVINRDMDLVILAELANATNDTGTAVVASNSLVEYAIAILGNNDVPVEEEDNLFAAITPAFRAYLRQTTEFSDGQYVDVKPMVGPVRKMWRWAGVNWMVNTQITGKGTNNELCYMWHRNALGYAINVGEDSIHIGYDEKQDTSWTRATVFHAPKILQNSGIVQIKHDGSAYAAQ